MKSLLSQFHAHMDSLPLVAILRGLKPEEALDVGQAIVNAGFHILEVPLNSPEPFLSIAALAARFKGRMVVGAGTVLDVDSVDQLRFFGLKRECGLHED